MGIDMTQFDQMGYKLVGGEKPVKKDQVLEREWFAHGFMDTLKNGEQRNQHTRRSYSHARLTRPPASAITALPGRGSVLRSARHATSLTTGTNYQGDQYTMNMYGGGGGTGGAGGNTVGQSENVTFDVRASGIVAGDYNSYATSDGLVMDLQALKELAAKVDPAAAKKLSTPMIKCWSRPSTSSPCPKSNHRSKLRLRDLSGEDMRKSLEEQSRAIQLILGGIGAVSLLSQAIGIANTMVMSVTERTREIGIMKALGCYVRDIRVMFLRRPARSDSSAD